MKIDKEAVGQRIKRLRSEKNMSMDTLAKMVGVSGKSTINEWEKGRSLPHDKNMNRLAKLFGVQADYIKHGSLSEYGLAALKEEIVAGDEAGLRPEIEDILGLTTDYYAADENPPLFKGFMQASPQEQIQKLNKWHTGVLLNALDDLFYQIRHDYESEISKQHLSYNDPDKLVSLFVHLARRAAQGKAMSVTGVIRTIKHDLNPFLWLGNVGNMAPAEVQRWELKEGWSKEKVYENEYLTKVSNAVTDFLDTIDKIADQYNKNKP